MAGLQWLCGMLAQKANKDGYYPDMHVGTADTVVNTLGLHLKPFTPLTPDVDELQQKGDDDNGGSDLV